MKKVLILSFAFFIHFLPAGSTLSSNKQQDDCEKQSRLRRDNEVNSLNFWTTTLRATDAKRCRIHKKLECNVCTSAEQKAIETIEAKYLSEIAKCQEIQRRKNEAELNYERGIKERLLANYVSKETTAQADIPSSKSPTGNAIYAFVYYDNTEGYDGWTPMKNRIPEHLYISEVIDISGWAGCTSTKATDLLSIYSDYKCSTESINKWQKKNCCASLWLHTRMAKIYSGINFWRPDRFTLVINDHITLKRDCTTGNEDACFTGDKEKMEKLRQEVIAAHKRNRVIGIREN